MDPVQPLPCHCSGRKRKIKKLCSKLPKLLLSTPSNEGGNCLTPSNFKPAFSLCLEPDSDKAGMKWWLLISDPPLSLNGHETSSLIKTWGEGPSCLHTTQTVFCVWVSLMVWGSKNESNLLDCLKLTPTLKHIHKIEPWAESGLIRMDCT